MAYDLIIAGAGSVGVPTAMALAELGLKPLVVDMHPSPGQGENKHAIGGIRATHSEPAKILTCSRSLEIFSTWQQLHGDNIEWLKGGYVFPVYRPGDAKMLKGLLAVQKKFGLKIDFVGPQDIKGIIHLEDLRKKVIAVEAFMIAAHPFRGFLVFGASQVGLTPEKAMERPLFKLVDGIEIMNGKVTEKENTFAATVAAGLGMPVTGGSDAHEVEEVGKYATCFPGMINDETDLLTALKNGHYSPVAFRKR